ncbi:filamentous hemagglutinin N-terminal domain-containing protein [Burkholderia cepacia]|nr:filamentous hemagglutinin N-terminal domain-containing protein [Burkholderia cepacia]UQP11803.1 filamentous hemagglutinin N-terminal domain-containing protein [Burkholderia cepacia]
MLTEWSSFNVDAGQRVKFNQPSASSIALNRVTGQQGSAINGSIDANGRVFLVNPNGVLFGSGAQVNVGGLVASTLDIKNADFAAGNYRFSGSPDSAVLNSGNLVAGEGGAIALLGAQVVNRGVVQAQMGTVALAAGDAITLNFDGSKLLNVQVDERAVNALASNERLLKADGGQVLMSARTANALLQTVVNNQGAIEARTLRNSAGRISLDGHDAGTVNVAGTLNASATTPGNGGTVDTRGADVKIALGATVDTRATNGRNGVWRIASSDLSVTPGASRQGTIVADTLSRNLGMTDIELVAEQGKLSVDGPVNWASGNQLTLTSRQGDVAVNGALRATGANAGVAIDAAQGAQINAPVALTGANARFKLDYVGTYSLGNSASVTLSGAGAGFESNGFLHTVIQTLAQLQAINANLGGLYVLGNDIAGGYYNTTFQTIGADTPFSGAFDGLGHSVSRLSITSGSPYAGLFGLNTGRIANLVLKSSNVGAAAGPGPVAIGAVAGENRGEIANVVVSDNTLVRAGASRSNVLGGLVGINRGSVAQSSFTGRVEGNGMTYAAGGARRRACGNGRTRGGRDDIRQHGERHGFGRRTERSVAGRPRRREPRRHDPQRHEPRLDVRRQSVQRQRWRSGRREPGRRDRAGHGLRTHDGRHGRYGGRICRLQRRHDLRVACKRRGRRQGRSGNRRVRRDEPGFRDREQSDGRGHQCVVGHDRRFRRRQSGPRCVDRASRGARYGIRWARQRRRLRRQQSERHDRAFGRTRQDDRRQLQQDGRLRRLQRERTDQQRCER